MFKRSTLVLVIIIVLTFAIGTGCGNTGDIPTAQPLTDSSVPEKSVQGTKTVAKISEQAAINKAQDILSQLSIDFGGLEKAAVDRDPVSSEEYWEVLFKGASVDIDPVTGVVTGISVRNTSKGKFIIVDEVAARKAAQELYSKLQAPPDYKFIDIKKGYTGDFWSANWEKEVLPGVYSKYESVNLMLLSDTGKLRGYRQFNKPPKSTDVRITQEEAEVKAREIAAAKGFKNLVDVKQSVELANDYWNGPKATFKDMYCTMVWVVTFKNSSGSKAYFYVDASTGLIVGGDQTR